MRRQTPLIQPRPRGRLVHGIVLSLLFAMLGAPLLMAKGWLVRTVAIEAGKPAPVTVRVPLFLGRTVEDMELTRGSIVVARGEPVEDPALVDSVRAMQPAGWGAWFTYLAGLFLAGMLFTAQLRRSHKGKLLRTQAVALAVILVSAALCAAALLATPVSVLALPVAALAILATVVIDLGAGLATAITAALVIGALTPFDPGVITVLGVQGAAAALVVGERPGRRRPTKALLLAAGAIGGGAAAASYFLIYYLSHNGAPLAELEEPLRSAWVAAGLAGLVGAAVAMPLLPLYQRGLGDISLGTLVELEDLSHPLLKQIAESSPGTWQHSLAMANMAEIAANAIGANGRLVRVGAYYHDLGKSLSPKFFVENLAGGETSPHDAIAPHVSCDAIFSHVTEGVRVARRQGLPERVIDFMHMHHGDGLLEYFWAKCVEQGNPDKLTEEDFRYPGVKPHSKETAILAICDAVEAASRTLRNPDAASIENLVQRIVYGKLHLGQLDESGLSVADLRKISKSLVETIKHAHHGRIEYPWQKQKRAEEAKANGDAEVSGSMPTALERPRAAAEGDTGPTDTQRLLREPRLDSLDVPRPTWRERPPPAVVAARRATPRPGALEIAPTEEMSADTPSRGVRSDGGEPSATASSTAVLTRPPTAAEVARATAPDMRAITADVIEESRAEPEDESSDEAHAASEASDAHDDDFGPFSRPEASDPAAAAPGDAPEAPELSDPAGSVISSAEDRPQTEWERALIMATMEPARPTPPPPPGSKRRSQREIDPQPPRATAHTIRRHESETEPVAEVTVLRKVDIPPEAVGDDSEGPTRPREPIPVDSGND